MYHSVFEFNNFFYSTPFIGHNNLLFVKNLYQLKKFTTVYNDSGYYLLNTLKFYFCFTAIVCKLKQSKFMLILFRHYYLDF